MAGRQQVNQNVDINKVQEKVAILFMTFLLLLLSNTHIVVVLLESVGFFCCIWNYIIPDVQSIICDAYITLNLSIN